MIRRPALVAVVLTVFMGLGPALATACTTPNWVQVHGDVRAGAGVTVTGGGYAAGPVEVRWNGMEGALLRTARAAADGTFTARVTIPEAAAPGLYPVVVLQPAVDGGKRPWAYVDVVLPALSPADHWAYVVALILLLSAAAAVLVVQTRRRSAAAACDEMVEQLARLLAENDTARVREHC